jgi:hypothetical protein
MFSEKNIIVTIGDFGVVVALYDGDEVKNKFFLDDLTDAAKTELKDFFAKNESSHIYILLDTIDQSYKKKIYPSVTKGDLSRIIKRDMNSDGDKDSMKNYFILNAKKPSEKKVQVNHRWECMFISASNSPTITKWIEFLLELPNRLVGIYMLPIEAFSLFTEVKNQIKLRSKVQNKKNDLYCLIIQNKVSGTRQMVFSELGLIFTRVVTYDFKQKDFLEKYEQDIYSTFEYLKRLFPDLLMSELDIVNVFPDETLEMIKGLHNVELNPINFNPSQLAIEAGQNKVLSLDSHFCDLLISKIFSEKKKILKFSTPKINVLDKFFLILKLSKYLSMLLAALIGAAFLTSLFIKHQSNESIKLAEIAKNSSSQNYEELKNAALNDSKESGIDKNISVERIMDFGKVEEVLGSVGVNFVESYVKLKFLKDFNVKLSLFSYSLLSFSDKSPSKNTSYKINFNGDLFNKSGDIEDLFREFDILTNEVKRNMEKQKVSYAELPRNIDFNKKYYNFPIDFSVTKN